MEVKDTKKVVDLINGELKETIQNGIYKHFGVHTNITAKIYGKGNIYITDSMNDVNKKMTCNKLLRKFIKESSIEGRAWMEQESNNIYITFYLSYKHTLGGSNGKEIGTLLINTNKNKVKLIKYII